MSSRVENHPMKNTATNSSPVAPLAVDVFALLVRNLTTSRTGIVLTHGIARVSRDAEGVYTLGVGPDGYALDQIDSVFAICTTVEEATREYIDSFPSSVDFMVSGEHTRLRWRTERIAGEIVNAAAHRAKSNQMTQALNAAMTAAQCACKVLLADMDDQSSSYGDRVGIIVYCDSAEGAKRTAEWIIKWEERDYEARGGKYGAGYGQAQHSYSVRDAVNAHGAPFAVFASFRYYSRGD